MTTHPIGISDQSLRALLDLAEQTGQTPSQVLDDAINAYHRRVFIEQVNAGYAALRADPIDWAAMQAERESMASSLVDGLNTDEEWDEDGWCHRRSADRARHP